MPDSDADGSVSSNRDLDALLGAWRDAIGTEAFERATPGQSLRLRTSILQAEGPTAVQRVAPGSAARSLAPKQGSLSNWNEYAVQELVAEGGMGQIFRADQGSLRRNVAVKKIIPEHLGKEGAEDTNNAFVSEALVTGFLDHPNIVPVYSLGQDERKNWFFSMKMVRGIAWKYLLHPAQCEDVATREKAQAQNLDIDDPARRTANLEENLKILQAVCNAVAFAHSKHIIHRDLKPENVMVGAFGEVLVMDWGLAVDISEEPSPTDGRVPHKSVAGLGGTPDYIAPEQAFADSSRLSTSTDVFLLGAILYELMEGSTIHHGDSLNEVLAKSAMYERAEFQSGAPNELQAVCRKATAKAPAERHTTADTFKRAVEDFLKHRQSALIAAKAEAEAKTQEIRNLARAVILFDQALELWPQNVSAQTGLSGARTLLARREQVARRTRHTAFGLAAAVFLSVSAGFFWVRAEKEATEKQRVIAVQEKEAAYYNLGKAYWEKAKRFNSENNLVYARLYAAKALGFQGYGAPRDLDAEQPFMKSHPVYIKSDNPEYELLDTYLKRSSGSLLWSSPISAAHIGPIQGVQYTRDGSMLVSGGGNELRFWDTKTGREARPSIKLPEFVHALAVSPDGHTVACCLDSFQDFAVHVFDIETGKQIGRFGGHEGAVTALAISPNGAALTTGSDDKTVRLWELKTGKPLAIFSGHIQRVNAVAFLPDGQSIVSGSVDSTVWVWNVNNKKERVTFEGHSGEVSCVAGTPDGLSVISGGADHTVRIWNLQTKTSATLIQGAWVQALAVPTGGGKFAAADSNNAIVIWDIASKKQAMRLTGHSNWLKSVAFSPDGATLASGSEDRTLRVWNAQTGRELTHPEGHTGAVAAVAFSRDGLSFVSAGWDRSVRLWDAASGKQLALFEGQPEKYGSVAIAPDGQSFAAGSADGTARVWDLKTGQERAKFPGARGTAKLAFNPAGTTLARGGFDGTVQLWDITTGKAGVLFRAKGPVGSVAFSRDGRELLSCHGERLVVWNVETGQQTAQIEKQAAPFRRAVLSPDGQLIADETENFELELRDARNGTSIGKMGERRAGIQSLEFSPDGSRLISCEQYTIRLWDVKTLKELAQYMGHDRPVLSAAFAPDGKTLLSGSEDGTVRLWDASPDKTLAQLRPKNEREPDLSTEYLDRINDMAFSNDGQALSTLTDDQTVRKWNMNTGAEFVSLQGASEEGDVAWRVALARDGQAIAVNGSQSGLRIRGTNAAGKWLKLGAFGSDVRMRFGPGGTTLASGHSDGSAAVWDTQSGAELFRLEGAKGAIKALAFSNDNQVLALGGYDNTIRLWDLNTHKIRLELAAHTLAVNCLDFSSDGSFLVSGGEDHTVRVWDVKTGKETAQCTGNSEQVNCVAFSPDGMRVASSGTDKTVRIWDARTGRSLAQFFHPNTFAVSEVRFSPDGELLVSASWSNTVCVWPAQPVEENLAGEVRFYNVDELDPQILNTSSDLFHSQTFEPQVPYHSYLAILQSHLPPPEQTKRLFQRYCWAKNVDSARWIYEQMPTGKEKEIAKNALDYLDQYWKERSASK